MWGIVGNLLYLQNNPVNKAVYKVEKTVERAFDKQKRLDL